MLKVFLYAGLYIGAIGMVVGLFTGLSICLFLAFVGLPLDPEVYYISELPVRLRAPDTPSTDHLPRRPVEGVTQPRGE